MRATWRLGRVHGVEIGVHWSVVLLVLMVGNILASLVLPTAAPDSSSAARWVAGMAGAALVAGAILFHEFAHVRVALRRGVPVASITLWGLGGVSEFRAEPTDADSELRIAIAGPLSSLFAAGVVLSCAVTASAVGASELVVATLNWVAATNVVLALFNLLPGSPLDGGRVLRALLWRHHGNRDSAARTAASAGGWLGCVLASLGFVEIVATGTAGGLWLIVIGWFIATSARQEGDAHRMLAALGDEQVGDVMTRDPVVVPAWSSLQDFIERTARHSAHASYPVVDLDGRPVGIIALSDVAAVPVGRRPELTAGQVCRPVSDCVLAAVGQRLADLVPRVARLRADRLVLVVEGPRLVGVLSLWDISRLTQRAVLLGTPPDSDVDFSEADRAIPQPR